MSVNAEDKGQMMSGWRKKMFLGDFGKEVKHP